MVRSLVACMVVLVVVLGSVFAGCGSSAPPTTAPTVPAGWVALEGGYQGAGSISLALPDSFEDVADASVAPFIEQALALDPSLDEAGALMRFSMLNLDLALVGEPDANGFQATVLAARGALASEFSFEQYVERYFQGKQLSPVMVFPEEGLVEESMTTDAAYFIQTWTGETGAATSVIQHYVFRHVGPWVYSVVYTTSVESAAEMEPIFRASAQTIVIEGQ